MKTGARAWEVCGGAVLLASLLAPMADTDLWWHLSAGRAILDSGSVPRAEVLSWTLPGTPWADFEWLAQAVFALTRLAGGAWGLWALKGVLMLGAGAGVLAAARAAALAAPGRAAALALFAAGILPRADIRTELFSILAFAWLLAGLERLRAADWPMRRLGHSTAAAAILFALWANTHAGFPMGLALMAAYLLGPSRRDLRWLTPLLVAVLATLMTPYGIQAWSVIAAHGRESDALRGLILEWGPLGVSRPGHAGPWLVVLAAAATVMLAAARGRAPAAPELLALAIAASTVRHARLSGYAAALSPLLAACAARLSHGLWERAKPRRGAAALCTAALLAALAAAKPWRLTAGPYDPILVPVKAAAWLASQKELMSLRLYNPWSWGGFLAERLAVPVFQDGRYLFHGLLAEQAEAVKSPTAWQAFLQEKGVELVLLENSPLMRDTILRGADGAQKPVKRPYYIQYMPRDAWAMVWFDDTALVFVRRDKLPQGTTEYRWLKPRDGPALIEARRLGLVDEAGLAAEALRHAPEAAEPAGPVL